MVEYGLRGRRRADRPTGTMLTPREAEVVALITQGFDNVSIARETSLSINSVKTYIRAAYQKIGNRLPLAGGAVGRPPRLPRGAAQASWEATGQLTG